MFFRIRVAFGLALVVSLFVSITAFAKGEFSFISITGPNLKEEVRSTDPALTTDFLAFFDFSQVKAEPPADPGVGYEVRRYYVDGDREIAFDHLHYYPDTGLVYYDGIVNGSSEYDGKWYTARPGIKAIFESALAMQTGSVAPVEKKQPITSASQSEADTSVGLPSLSVILIVSAVGLAALTAFAFWQRKSSTQ
jgi:hypothetical protein